MYAKIFRQIYDSTLAENWEALVTFQQLLVLADYHGEVDMTPGAIHRVTGIPQNIIETGIKKLMDPDPKSRSQEEDGRRIILIDPERDWGWVVVNFKIYRAFTDEETKREQTRIRVQRHRVTHGNAEKRPVTHGNGLKRHTDTDLDTDLELELQNPKTYVTLIDFETFFWAEYPSQNGKKVGKHECFEFVKANFKLENLPELLKATKNYALSEKVENGFRRDPIRFLKKKYWRDWIEAEKVNNSPYSDSPANGKESPYADEP